MFPIHDNALKKRSKKWKNPNYLTSQTSYFQLMTPPSYTQFTCTQINKAMACLTNVS